MLPPSLVWRWRRLKAVARTCSRLGVGEQVAGELPGDELVVGHVLVERPDDPVAPGPDGPVDVGLVAVGVGVAGQVEPVDGHPLAEPGRGEQPVDQPLVGAGRVVGQEGVDLVEGRGQAGQVEASRVGSAAPCSPRATATAPRTRAGPARSGRSGSGATPASRTSGTATATGGIRDQCCCHCGPLLDPAVQQLDLLAARAIAPESRRRHPVEVVLGGDPPVDARSPRVRPA